MIGKPGYFHARYNYKYKNCKNIYVENGLKADSLFTVAHYHNYLSVFFTFIRHFI